MKDEYVNISNIMYKYLSTIKFSKKHEDDYSCSFSNKDGWIVLFTGDRYYNEFIVWIVDPKDDNKNRNKCQIGAIARSIGIDIGADINAQLNFIVDNKEYIFNNEKPYKIECDKRNSYPEWLIIKKK